MGWFSDNKKKNDPQIGETKDVTNWGKKIGKVGKDAKTGRWVALDKDGKALRNQKGELVSAEDEETARKRTRKAVEREQQRAAGGGVRGQEQNPRADGEGRSRGAAKRAGKPHQPGDILKAHLDDKKKRKGK